MSDDHWAERLGIESRGYPGISRIFQFSITDTAISGAVLNE